MKETRQKLDQLLTFKAEAALRSVNQNYYEKSNRASKLLAYQLRKKQSERIITKIRHHITKEMKIKPRDIADAFAEYYKHLYDDQETLSQETKMQKFMNKFNLPMLTPEQALEMTEPVSLKEILDTIKNLKNNKSPGPDGFPGEFYKCFIEEIAPLLKRVFNYALESGNIPTSWSEAVISVLHKEGKDTTLCESYRPVSLLCNDLKIVTNIMAKRIQTHIKLINPDQTGFMPGRQGANNIR